MENFKKLMQNGNISFYGYSKSELPKEIKHYSSERVSIFFKPKTQKNNLKSKYFWHSYSGYKDTPWDSKDIVFFDQNATKSLIIGFPTTSKFVAISLSSPRYYIYIIIGLFRRLQLKSAKIKGIKIFSTPKKLSPWLVLECKKTPTNSFSINRKIGISGLLKFLSLNKVKYIVPRFYEKLPNLLTHDSDLDLIINNKYVEKVENFLKQNSGSIPVDVWTDFGTDYHGMSYMPPNKAKSAIENAIQGPGGSMIPTEDDALNLIIYHALYHKGYVSNIKSCSKNVDVHQKNNKYLNVIIPLSRKLDKNVGNTLEEMDHYMELVGWKPAIDTLTKIAQWNEWVRTYHMSGRTEFFPLYVFILKQGLKDSEGEKVVKENCSNEGLHILEERELVGQIKDRSISDLRGGVWNDSLSHFDQISNFYPYKILILLDKVKKRTAGTGIKKVKERLRKLVDKQKTSFIHSTDNYTESLDYIKVCMPDRYKYYHDQKKILKDYGNLLEKKVSFSVLFNLIIVKSEIFIKKIIIRIVGH